MGSRGTTLVTGSTGFVGSAVVRHLLAAGRQVRCYVEPGADRTNLAGLDVEVARGDINDRRRVREAMAGCTVLYHLAAIYKLWLPDNSLMYEVNVEGTKTVLFAALAAGLDKVVYTSAVAAVGHPESGELADETTQFNLWTDANHYVRSKWLGERDAMRFAAEGLPVVVVNPTFAFGERDRGPTPTGQLMIDALCGRVPGYLEGGLNIVDVEDVAAAHLLAEQRGVVGQRYILGNSNVSYREFYAAIAEVGGSSRVTRRVPSRLLWALGWAMEQYADHLSHEAPALTYKTARYATRKLWFDCSRAHSELGMPLTPLCETLEKSIRWFRANGYA